MTKVHKKALLHAFRVGNEECLSHEQMTVAAVANMSCQGIGTISR